MRGVADRTSYHSVHDDVDRNFVAQLAKHQTAARWFQTNQPAGGSRDSDGPTAVICVCDWDNSSCNQSGTASRRSASGIFQIPRISCRQFSFKLRGSIEAKLWKSRLANGVNSGRQKLASYFGIPFCWFGFHRTRPIPRRQTSQINVVFKNSRDSSERTPHLVVRAEPSLGIGL